MDINKLKQKRRGTKKSVWMAVIISFLTILAFSFNRARDERAYSWEKFFDWFPYMILGALFAGFISWRFPLEKENANKIVMCKKCESPFYEVDIKNQCCPNCGGKLEPLDGFYERNEHFK